MKKIRLGVNIDHVATVRNARGENYPSPLRASLLAEKCGADSVTIHLREDRRHINELDLKKNAHLQLLHENIPNRNIEISNLCTYDTKKEFHSYRRNKTNLRQWNFICSEN